MEFSTLKKKADLTEGEWVDCSSVPGMSVKVRSVRYKLYRDEMALVTLVQGEGTDNFAAENGRLLAKHILLDWKGLPITDKGKPLPYSAKNAEFIMTFDDDHGICDSVKMAVWNAAQEVAQRIKERAGKASGN